MTERDLVFTMADGKISTVRLIDPRIEPQPDPLYSVTTGPKQNQFYILPPSGISNSYITFNNLTTLGTDRAYLDTFELEITATITMNIAAGQTQIRPYPFTELWTFESFPFNKCCEEIRVNINGGAFFSQPLSYLRAKERYWDTKRLAESYANVCPYHKPLLQHESGCKQWVTTNPYLGNLVGHDGSMNIYTLMSTATGYITGGLGLPARCGQSVGKGYAPTEAGVMSAPNNSIVPNNYESSMTPPSTTTITVRWREPIFASPFSSRLDETYGRPLYNITSMDLAFNMQDLGNMIRVVDPVVTSYSINLDNVRLCYQVETLPPNFSAPSMTVVPYRRLVPYITDAPDEMSTNGTTHVTMTSGVYTLNEIPTAIWVFAAPTKAALQGNLPDTINYCAFANQSGTSNPTKFNTQSNMYGFNKLFGFMTNISISCANTTQILNTASVHDLYRIAKANGCKDSFEDWSNIDPHSSTTWTTLAVNPADTTGPDITYQMPRPFRRAAGAGSVLRLIPGTDIVLPEQELIPGANANNLVFQVSATFDIPACYGNNYRKYSLWLLFEYVGVATITPGQCQISMNPLGNGSVMNSAPVVSAAETAAAAPESTTDMVEGSGLWDKIKSGLRSVSKLAKKTGLVSKALKFVPHVGDTLSKAASAMGYGFGGVKRPRLEGGAVMGMGDFI